MQANHTKSQDQDEGMMAALTKYNTAEAVEALKPADYSTFLQGNFGSAAQTIEKYYPLSVFEAATDNSTALAVLAAIAQVITDYEYKCAGYQSAVQAASKNVSTWVYEFSHNSTCAWLNTMPQADVSVFGAAHTAEIAYVFGNLKFNFPSENTTCTGSQAEWNLSKQMMSLWTAMAENANPSSEALLWPHFQTTTDGTSTPGMIFGNSSTPGLIDFSACRLWSEVDSILSTSNATAMETSSSSSGSSTPSSTDGAATASLATRAATTLSVFLTAVSALLYICLGI